MTATIVYDKSIFDVNSISDEGRYGFKVQKDSAAKSGDAPSATQDEGEKEKTPSEGADEMSSANGI